MNTLTETKQRQRKVLTDTFIKSTKPTPGKTVRLADASGLFMLVKPNGSKLWRSLLYLHGKQVLVALGKYPETGLAEAREALAKARKQVAAGIHPNEAKAEAKIKAIQEAQSKELGTFAAACASWREVTNPDLRPSSMRQREREIKNDLLPTLKTRHVASITRVELTALLRKVEKRAPETSKNLRAHLDGIFEHAIDSGLLDTNPTPPRRILKKRNQTNHAALPANRIGDFLRAVDASGMTAHTRIAMLLTVMTASRKDEIISARWSELHMEAGQFIIPKERMKKKRDHIIPLSTQAIALLRDLRDMVPVTREHLFPNRRDANRPMANRSLNAVMERLGFGDEGTPHGFRAAFSTHFNELEANPDVVELCLSHPPRGVRGDYNRALMLDQRREMLQQWSDFLDEQRGGPTVPPLEMSKHGGEAEITAAPAAA